MPCSLRIKRLPSMTASAAQGNRFGVTRPPRKPEAGGSLRRVVLFILFCGLILVLNATRSGEQPAAAQTNDFWQFDAQGRLNLILPADTDADGIEEFLVASDDFNLSLVDSSGVLIWELPPTQEQILSIVTLSVSPEVDLPGIVVGTRNQLLGIAAKDGRILWRSELVSAPIAMAPLDVNQDGVEEVVIATRMGRLQLYDMQNGRLIWTYVGFEDPNVRDARPVITVADFDGDSQDEIAFSYDTQRGFTQLVMVNDQGKSSWSHSLPGSITAQTPVYLDRDAPPFLAVGTNRGQLHLYEGVSGSVIWFRTPNRAITVLKSAVLDGRTAIIAGTEAGTLLAFDEAGRRIWDINLSDSPLQAVRDILVAPGTGDGGSQPARLAALLTPAGGGARSGLGTLLLLNADGRQILNVPANDARGLNHLLDVNRDGFTELLLASFGSISLRDLGLGSGAARSYGSRWIYRLEASPAAVIPVSGMDGGQNYLIAGTSDGRLIMITSRAGTANVIKGYEGPISQIGFIEEDEGMLPILVVVYQRTFIDSRGLDQTQSSIDLIRPGNPSIWSEEITLDGAVTLLEILDINENGDSEILVGTEEGDLLALGLNRRIFWRTSLGGAVSHLIRLDEGASQRPELIVALQTGRIFKLTNKGAIVDEANLFGEILALVGGEDRYPVLAVTGAGSVVGLNQLLEPLPNWSIDFPRPISRVIQADQSLIMVFDRQDVIRLELDPENPFRETWRLSFPISISKLYWNDFNGDARPDLAIGDREGNITLMTGSGQPFATISLSSTIYDLMIIGTDEGAMLLSVTENGMVHGLAAQPNRPPLLVNPDVEIGEESLSFSISVIDVDRDPVNVTLLLYNASSGEWETQGERRAARGNDLLFWVVQPPGSADTVRYRFEFDDGTYFGRIEPAPLENAGGLSLVNGWIFFVGSLSAAVLVGILLLPTFSPINWQGRRIYRRLVAAPGQTLHLLDAAYTRLRGSPDVLLNLASRARRDGRQPIATLVDGLFLLAERTPAGLELMITAIDAAWRVNIHWHHAEIWRQLFQTSQALLAAQSVADLGMLRPRLLQLTKDLQAQALPAVSFEALLQPLTSFRDSSRVTRVDDRLAYLHEAAVLLRQEQALLSQRPMTVQNTVATAIVNRWHGLANALIDDLRGRPWIVISLKTKRLVAGEPCLVALQVENSGQAAAEEVQITLQENPDFAVINGSQTIPYLPVRRSRTIQFMVAPHVPADFRLTFSIAYKDAHLKGHEFEFADMVRQMSNDREFTPIPNPYSPGTPLRKASPLFVGRENLLSFIIETAGRTNQQNVLILVGQRRTGKTSLLLRLGETTPAALLPVYIDCQSLGVVAGMPAFLNDLAWYISDALEERGLEIGVPDRTVWETDPANYFQRTFLKQVQAALPGETRLLLIFDEFEAFENLVNDGILPPTFFPFLRHLMQHGQGLNFIFSGTHRLEEMTSAYWSVLFNIALYRQIGFLDEPAARELITRPVEPFLIYDDLALDKIWRVTAGHPYFLQLVCYTLVNHANKNRTGYITVSDVNVTLKEMLRLGEVHFAYLWQQSTLPEKALLTAIAHLHDAAGPIHPIQLAGSLQAYDIYIEPGEVSEALQRLVTRGILQEVNEEGATLVEIRVGLVGMWVAENKSLSELYEKAPET